MNLDKIRGNYNLQANLMQQMNANMYMYCPECHLKVLQSGITAEFYHMITEFYITHDDPLPLYVPYFDEALRYLEINGYITTTECAADTVFAKPRLVALDDNETVIFCSQTCSCNVIDFKTGTE